jgi:hypothetical protein
MKVEAKHYGTRIHTDNTLAFLIRAHPWPDLLFARLGSD